MTGKKRILLLGISQSNFLSQLYGELIKKVPTFSVDIDGYYDVSKGAVQFNSVFDQHYDFKKIKLGRVALYKAFFSFMLTPFFWEICYFELSQRKKITTLFKILFSYAWSKTMLEKEMLPLKHSIYHFHFCTPENLKFLHFFPSHAFTICSFWGSDLMRLTGVENVFYVRRALLKAKTITIQNIELAEMMYCKYGRDLATKTQIAQFTINTEIYDTIDNYRDDLQAVNSFKRQHGIPLDKIVVGIAHNAFRENNHLHIIKAIQKCPPALREQLVLLLPLGYGRSADYLQELDNYITQQDEVQCVQLHSFFGPNETALLRLATDLMIQMPVSDALSAAMTEVLYASNTVVVGAWLPYGILRRNQIQLLEAESFDELPKILETYLMNTRPSILNTQPIKIRSFLFPDTTTAQWIKIFETH